MTIQRVQKSLKSSRLRKIVYCKKRGGVCFWWENEMIHFDFLISSAINLISTKALVTRACTNPQGLCYDDDTNKVTLAPIYTRNIIIILLLSWPEGKQSDFPVFNSVWFNSTSLWTVQPDFQKCKITENTSRTKCSSRKNIAFTDLSAIGDCKKHYRLTLRFRNFLVEVVSPFISLIVL